MEVFVLEIRCSYQGKDDVLYPVLLRNGKELVLVDCGYAGSMPLLQAAANRHGISLDALTGILITHHDIGHMGGVQELKMAYSAAKVYASATEAPYNSGKEKSLRLQQAEALYDTLPEDLKAWARQLQETLKAVQAVAVNGIASESGVPASWGDMQIIPTPGHTPGHISVYLPQSKTLLAADAVVVEKGELELANPALTLNPEQAVASVRNLLQLEVDQLICYHGGIVEKDIREKLERLVEKYTPVQPPPASSDKDQPDAYSSPACYAHLKDFREGF